MQANFPVFIREKDGGDMFYASSIKDIQYHLERVDVEGGEFEAWDANGVPLKLVAHDPIWLDLKPLDSLTKQMDLIGAISDFAARKGVNNPDTGCSYAAAIDQIRTQSRSKSHSSLFGRLFKK